MAERYVGLDVSLAATAICIVDGGGAILLETSTASESLQIYKAVRPYRRGLRIVAQESGALAARLHRDLAACGLPMVCLHAKAARAAMRAQRNKTDKNDARDLAELVRRGFKSVAYIKSNEAIALRALLTARRTIKRKAIDLQMTILGVCRHLGVDEAGRAKRDRRTRRPPLILSSALAGLSAMTTARDALLHRLRALDTVTTRLAKADPICRRLMTVPGVGPLTALTFKAAVDDPTRFRRSRLVAAHFGLTPRRIQSGASDYGGHISRFGDGAVRTALYEAALVMLVHSRTPTKLRAWGLRLAKSRGHKFAAVTCARKLAVLLHRLWITGCDFDPARA